MLAFFIFGFVQLSCLILSFMFRYKSNSNTKAINPYGKFEPKDASLKRPPLMDSGSSMLARTLSVIATSSEDSPILSSIILMVSIMSGACSSAYIFISGSSKYILLISSTISTSLSKGLVDLFRRVTSSLIFRFVTCVSV